MNSDCKKWECEIIAPPELHKPIQELFDAMTWQVRKGQIKANERGKEKMVLIDKYSLLDDIDKMIAFVGDDGWEKIDRSDLIHHIKYNVETFVIDDDKVDKLQEEQI